MPENKWVAKRRRWARLLQELEDSGFGVREFARKRRVHERVLRRWITMAKRGEWTPSDYLEEVVAPADEAAPRPAEDPGQEPATQPTAPLQLVAVTNSPEARASAPGEAVPSILPVTLIGPPLAEFAYELTFGGRQLRLPRDFEVHRVARLVRAIETATC